MSLEQYKDASRAELWEILQIQAEEFKFIEKENKALRAVLPKYITESDLDKLRKEAFKGS